MTNSDRPKADIRTFEASDGYEFHYRHWLPESGDRRGRVVALHGIQSHSGWYDYSSRLLCEAGYEVFFLDRRGSGMNTADRGHAPHQDRLLNDVVQFVRGREGSSDADHSRVPTILLGVSWGGKLAAAVCARYPDMFHGLALLYPGIFAQVRPTWLQSRQLDLADALDVRRRLVDIPLSDPALFTAEASWQQFIRDDELALHQVTTGFLLSSRQLDGVAETLPVRWSRPTLVMLAGRDRIIDNKRTRPFVRRFDGNAMTFIEYPDTAHTLEFEPEREGIFADLLSWLHAIEFADEAR